MSKKQKQIPCQNTTFHVTLTVLGLTGNAMVDTKYSVSIISTAAVAQIHL